jgi:four helix bundle protein
MARSNFEKLQVYQLAEKLADTIWDIVLTWQYFAKATVGEQLVDAADSVGSNIAEGSGRGSLRDNLRFVKIARGSLYETKYWLRRAYNRKLLKTGQVDALKPLVDELTPKLNGYYRYLDQAAKTEQKIKAQRPKYKAQRSKYKARREC